MLHPCLVSCSCIALVGSNSQRIREKEVAAAQILAQQKEFHNQYLAFSQQQQQQQLAAQQQQQQQQQQVKQEPGVKVKSEPGTVKTESKDGTVSSSASSLCVPARHLPGCCLCLACSGR